MKLTPIKCPQCDGVLNINISETTTKCPFCNTTFFIEDGINVYINKIVCAGDTFIKLQDYHLAKDMFKKLTDEYPLDYRGWWGLIKVKTENFTGYMNHISEWNSIYSLYEKVTAFANDDDLVEISKTFAEYEKGWNAYYTQLTINRETELQAIKNEYETQIAKLNNEVNIIEQKLKEKADEYNAKENRVLFTDFVIVLGITIIASIVYKSTIGNAILGFFVLGAIGYFFGDIIVCSFKKEKDVCINKLKQDKDKYNSQIPLLDKEYRKETDKIKEKYCMLNNIK